MKHQDSLVFPEGFLWGTATAAHQVEGNNTNNDWWAFEQRPGAIWHGDRSGLACDWWRNAEQDFDLMAQMGHNSHRLSVEWSRIEPREGEFDPRAIARYREMLAGLQQRGIEPMVTLFHFSSPLWLAQQGGWSNPVAVHRFRRFVRHTLEQLGDRVKLWCTINEPNVYAALGYLLGEHAPGDKSLILYFRVLRNLMEAHAAAYRVIHALDGEAQVGLVKNVPLFEPLDPNNKLSLWATRLIDRYFNEVTLRAVAEGRMLFPVGWGLTAHGPLVDSLDFVGLNYYARERISLPLGTDQRRGFMQPTPGAEVSDSGRNGPYGEIYPEGLYRALKRLAKLGKPIYVTENGLPDADDDQRPCFLLGHLAQIQRAAIEGVDVRGYYHWSFTDNFEWAEGWALRFGLVALDERSQVRSPRPSAKLYSEIARANAITRSMVQQFAAGTCDDLLD
ncbi:MAG: glycoside hydrolase family 1 protein [Anaerolineae bacterium]|jgi:beta-glucosidase